MKVIIINGPMGVGKTAAGKYIARNTDGCAFIDGDMCMDIHPFVGNKETKAMAVDNILHLTGNYSRCTVCSMVVLVWLMDDEWVRDSIIKGMTDMSCDITSVTLVCDSDELVKRWKNDKSCEWRTDDWLNVSLRSLPLSSTLENTIDTTELSIEQTAEAIMKLLP